MDDWELIEIIADDLTRELNMPREIAIKLAPLLLDEYREAGGLSDNQETESDEPS